MASYDPSLLKDTRVTKADKQEGYDVDLLNRKNDPTPRSRTNSLPAEEKPDLEAGKNDRSQQNGNRQTPSLSASQRRPWWKTRNAMIIFAVLAIVIVGAVVGGAVGGTHHNTSKATTSSVGPSSSNGGDSGTGLGNGGSNGNNSASTNAGLQGALPTPSSSSPPPSSSNSAGGLNGSHNETFAGLL